jgi:hypothetical protein
MEFREKLAWGIAVLLLLGCGVQERRILVLEKNLMTEEKAFDIAYSSGLRAKTVIENETAVVEQFTSFIDELNESGAIERCPVVARAVLDNYHAVKDSLDKAHRDLQGLKMKPEERLAIEKGLAKAKGERATSGLSDGNR